MSTLLNIALGIADHTPWDFIAPVPNAERVQVWSVQDDITYAFPLRAPKIGWWIVSPTSQSRATLRSPAQICDIVDYLKALPRVYVIVCHRLAEQTWLCVPFNAADAAQRGWPNGEPKPVHLVRHAIRPFDVVRARSLAGMILYDDVATRVESMICSKIAQAVIQEWKARGSAVEFTPMGLNASFRNALLIIMQQVRREQQEAQAREAQEKRGTLEGQIEWSLDFVGAQLVGWQESGEGLLVRWMYDGYEHEARVKRDLVLDSAGICLGGGGEERGQNLMSTVAVIQEARKRHRFDLDEGAWI